MPGIKDIMWAAGFWEGEGAVGIRSAGASQTSKWPLLKLKGCFGGAITVSYKANGNRKTCWQWWICGDDGRAFIKAIYPYLSPRRQLQINSVFITEEKRVRHRASIRQACRDRSELRDRNSLGRFGHAAIS